MPTQKITASPLCWPPGWPRTQSPVAGAFKTSLAEARDGLFDELWRLGAGGVVVSSNAQLLKDGRTIAGRQPYLSDTGVAAWFTLDRAQKVIPVDRFVLLEHNVQACRLIVNALRGLDRWGYHGIVSAAFRGFEALPERTDDEWWWGALGLDKQTATEADLWAAYRRLAKETHPDNGGSAEAFRRVVAAKDAALDLFR